MFLSDDFIGYRSKAMQSKTTNKQFGEFVYISIEDNDYFNRVKITTYLRSSFFTSHPSYFADLEQVKKIIKNLKKAQKILLKEGNTFENKITISKDVAIVNSCEGYPMIILNNDNANASQLVWDRTNLENLNVMIRNFNKAVKYVEATVKKGRRVVTNVYERVDR